jgi:hypothetical protein
MAQRAPGIDREGWRVRSVLMPIFVSPLTRLFIDRRPQVMMPVCNALPSPWQHLPVTIWAPVIPRYEIEFPPTDARLGRRTPGYLDVTYMPRTRLPSIRQEAAENSPLSLVQTRQQRH